MKQAFCALLVALICIGSGCKDSEAPAGGYVAIDAKLVISLQEALGLNLRPLTLVVTTQKLYDCSNFSIIAQPQVTGQTIVVNFSSIYEPPTCAAGRDSARGTVDLGMLASGTYQLLIVANTDTTHAQLTVTDSTYAVTGGEARWTTFRRTQLSKIPSDAIWGDAEYNATNSLSIYNSFLDSLTANGAVVKSYPPGDYGFFVIDANGTVIPPPLPSHPFFANAFIRQYTGDMTRLQNVVRYFGQVYGDYITINLYGPHGEAYHSYNVSAAP